MYSDPRCSRFDPPATLRASLRLNKAALLLLGVSVLLQGSLSASQDQLTVRLPEWASNARCIVRGKTQADAEQRGPAITFRCPAEDQVVSCDSEGVEPIDLAVAEVCRTAQVPMQKAGTATVEVDAPGDLAVEWLAIQPRGEFGIVATRRNVVAHTLRLQMATSDDRFIRFSRLGVSPVTVAAEDLLRAGNWRLPAPQPGGELFGRIEPATVLPASYRLVGRLAVVMSHQTSGAAVSRGLPAGLYELVPIYEGGPTGRPMKARVHDATSTVVFLNKEPVGAIDVSADAGVCSQTSELRVSATSERPARDDRITTRRVMAVMTHGGNCQRRVSGLRQGSYDVEFRNEDGPYAWGTVAVKPQSHVAVHVTSPEISLSGRVTLNDKPASNLTVEVRSFSSNAPTPSPTPVTATVDVDGSYRAVLDRPGDYSLRLRTGQFGLLGQERRVTVHDGLNVYNWDVRGGSVTIQVTGWDRATPLSLMVLRLSPDPGVLMQTHRIAPDEGDQIQIDGLAFGQYWVEARQYETPVQQGRPERVSPRTTIVLSEDNPTASVVLPLIENRAELELVDGAGQVVPGAAVSGGRPGLREVEPGIISLKGVPPGSELHIDAKGFAPSCVSAPRDGRLKVVLRDGRSLAVEFVSAEALYSPTGAVIPEGSTCPLRLTELRYSRVDTGSEGRSRFFFVNFPNVRRAVFLGDTGDARTLTIPEDGPLVISIPRPQRK